MANVALLQELPDLPQVCTSRIARVPMVTECFSKCLRFSWLSNYTMNLLPHRKLKEDTACCRHPSPLTHS